MNWFVLVLMSLTSYRVTRLLVKDDLPPIAWARDRLVGGWRPLNRRELEYERLPAVASGEHATIATLGHVHNDGGTLKRWVQRSRYSPWWLAELLSCPWCVSAYVSGALTAVVDLTYGVPVPWLVAPAVWAVAAVLASREGL